MTILTAQAQYSYTIGDNAPNVFTRIKAFGNDRYATGKRINPTNGLSYATFSRFDAAGVPIWHVILDIPSTATDFERITDKSPADSTGYLLIGYTEPAGSNNNNQSFIAHITPSGVVSWVRLYDQPGRESFSRIVRRGGPPSFPTYYISGFFNDPNNAPSTIDKGVVWHVKGDGTVLNRWRFDTPGDIDSELGLSIINWDAATLLVIGNKIDANSNRYGVIFRINENTGAVSQPVRLPNNHLIRDAYRAGTNNSPDLLISGYEYGSPATNRSFVAQLNGGNFSTSWWRQVFNQRMLYDLGMDATGRVYATGALANGEFAVHCFDNTTNALLMYARRIVETGNTAFEEGHIWVRPTHNRIFYADARNRGANSLGGLDVLFGAYHLDFKDFDCDTLTPKDVKPLDLQVREAQIVRTVLDTLPYKLSKGIELKYERKALCIPLYDCCENTRIVPSNNADKCCSRLKLGDCSIKNVNVSLSAGVFSSISVTSPCYTAGNASGQTSYNLTPTAGCIFQFIDVCPQPVVNQATVVTYTVTFSDGQICTVKDTIACEAMCCPNIVQLPRTEPCCARVDLYRLKACKTAIASIGVSGVSGGTISNISATGSCTASGVNQINFSSPCVLNGSNPLSVQVCGAAAANNPSGIITYVLNVVLADAFSTRCTIRDTIYCCPPPPPCCPEVKPIYSNCAPLPLMHGLFTVSGSHCLNSMSITWTPGLNPAGNITFSNPTAQSVSWSGPGSFTYNFGNATVSNLQFGLSSAIGINGQVTVTFKMCDGTECKKVFAWNKIPQPNQYRLESSPAKTSELRTATISITENEKGETRAKYIGIGFADKGEINEFLPRILAVSGAKHPAEEADSKTMLLEKSANSPLNALFELDDSEQGKREITLVYTSKKPDLHLSYLVFDAEGNILGQDIIVLNAQANPVAPRNSALHTQTDEAVISPNPAAQYINLAYVSPEPRSLRLEILDATGRVARATWKETSAAGDNTFSIDVSGFSAGAYLLKISHEKGGQTLRFNVLR